MEEQEPVPEETTNFPISEDEEAVMKFLVEKFESSDKTPIEDNGKSTYAII